MSTAQESKNLDDSSIMSAADNPVCGSQNVTTAISACGSCIPHPASLFLFESTFHQVAALLLSPLCLLQTSVFLLFRAETPYDCLYSMVKYATFQCQNSDYFKSFNSKFLQKIWISDFFFVTLESSPSRNR